MLIGRGVIRVFTLQVDQEDIPMGGWSTSDEIKFLAGLGTHSQNTPEKVEDVPREERLRLLKNYKQSIPLRQRWGPLNPEIIEKAVNSMIARLEPVVR